MPKKLRQTLSDLRSSETIDCLYCEQSKPSAGAQRFRACYVCADCARKLQLLGREQPAKSKSA